MIEKMIEKLLEWYLSKKTTSEQPVEKPYTVISACNSESKEKMSVLDELQEFLCRKYDFRYNLLSEQTEYCELASRGKEDYPPVAQRDFKLVKLKAPSED